MSVEGKALPMERFVDALEKELLLAHDRLRRRRRKRGLVMRAAIAVVAIVGVGSAFVAVSSDDPAAASSVEVETLTDGSRQVTVLDINAPIAEIEAELNRAGIDAEVVPQATGPSRIGEVITVVFTEGGIPLSAPGSRTFEIPAGYGGRVVINIGVQAADGQMYDQPALAFAEGEPLADLPVEQRKDAVRVYEAALERGMEVVARGPGGREALPPDGAEVLDAAMLAADVLALNWVEGS